MFVSKTGTVKPWVRWAEGKRVARLWKPENSLAMKKPSVETYQNRLLFAECKAEGKWVYTQLANSKLARWPVRIKSFVRCHKHYFNVVVILIVNRARSVRLLIHLLSVPSNPVDYVVQTLKRLMLWQLFMRLFGRRSVDWRRNLITRHAVAIRYTVSRWTLKFVIRRRPICGRLVGWRRSEIDHALFGCPRCFGRLRILGVTLAIVHAIGLGLWICDDLTGVNVDVMVWREHCNRKEKTIWAQGEHTQTRCNRQNLFDANWSAKRAAKNFLSFSRLGYSHLMS